MQLDELNALGTEAATEAVRACANVESWVATVVAARPYATLEALMTTAIDAAATWSAAEVEAALADHPRIGERHAGAGTSAGMSRSEQAGVDDRDAEIAARLAAGNAAYEQRFDRIFLVRAAGRSAEEMLAMLEERLGNDPDVEIEVTKGQLAEIAVLRLRGLFDPATR